MDGNMIYRWYILSLHHKYVECESFLRSSRDPSYASCNLSIRHLEILDEEVVVNTPRDDTFHTQLPQVRET